MNQRERKHRILRVLRYLIRGTLYTLTGARQYFFFFFQIRTQGGIKMMPPATSATETSLNFALYVLQHLPLQRENISACLNKQTSRSPKLYHNSSNKSPINYYISEKLLKK